MKSDLNLQDKMALKTLIEQIGMQLHHLGDYEWFNALKKQGLIK